MSVTVDWMDSRYSVIHANFVDQWNWSELYSALETAHTLMTRSSCPITLMLDFIGSTKVSATSALFTIAENIEAPENVYRIVIVCDDATLAPKMDTLLHEIYPLAESIILTNTHQEAFEKVRRTIEMKAVE
ncbi:MAG: hypothetical protein ACFE0Q_12555 [Anaerolineae bacterium]